MGQLLDQPRVRLGDGPSRRLDDVLGPRLAVIGAEDPREWLDAESLDFLARIDAMLLSADDFEDQEGWLDELIERHGTLVVRPDRYIFGVARDGSELTGVIERFRRSLLQD